jgi:ring-1,2-phenylacetyl-CoA epoxidase subunit PaaE
MNIKKLYATVTTVTDLSKSARDYTLLLPENLGFVAGQFVNIFMDIDGKKVRRAYSISSSDSIQNSITVSIRHSPDGVMTPVMWSRDMTGETLEIIGPLGFNTGDKMHAKEAYLFGYGVGAGVVKSILDHVLNEGRATTIVVITGSRSEDEILHKEYFDQVKETHPEVEIRYAISQPEVHTGFRKGYIQDNIEGIDFSDADVYACGQEKACTSLVEKIKAQNPTNCSLFIEAFH